MGPELLQLVLLGMYIICACCWVAIPTPGHRWVSTGYPNYAVSMLSLTPKYRDIVAQIPHLGDKSLATSARSNPHPEAHFWDIKFYLLDILNTIFSDILQIVTSLNFWLIMRLFYKIEARIILIAFVALMLWIKEKPTQNY